MTQMLLLRLLEASSSPCLTTGGMWFVCCGFSVFQNKQRGLPAGGAVEGLARLAPGLSRRLEPRPGVADLPEPWAPRVTGARPGTWWAGGGRCKGRPGE